MSQRFRNSNTKAQTQHLGNPSRSLAGNTRSLKLQLVVLSLLAVLLRFPVRTILIICRMSYFLALERSAVFLAAQTADAGKRRLDALLVFIKTYFAKGAPV